MSVPPRTTALAVQGILLDNYGLRADGSAPDLTGYIESASDVVDQAVVFALSNKNITLGATTQELMERWLSAYFYCKADPTYSSRSTEGASASFDNDSSDPERFRKGAIDIDYSGCLSAILKRQFAQGFWAGQNECNTPNRGRWYDRWQ